MRVSKRSLIIGAAALVAMLALIGTASAGAPAMREAGKGPPSSSALEKIDAFKQTLDSAGFDLEQAEFSFWDLVKDTCEGVYPDTLANNPWPNAYLIIKKLKSDGSSGGASGRINTDWQLREDEAMVLVGQTPPPAAYFSYQTFIATLPDDPDTPINENLLRMGSAAGDTINIGTINTIGPDKYRRPVVIIITGNVETERRVRAAALKAGYPDAIINVEKISPAVGPLGRGDGGSRFVFVHRVAVPNDSLELQDYARTANSTYRVFRLTPRQQLAADPEPVPVLRVRGTGHTEMELYPAVKQLRLAILDTYKAQGFDAAHRKDLDTKVWQLPTPPLNREMILEKPYVGLQRGYQLIGATRDTNYLATYPNFTLGCDMYSPSPDLTPDRRCTKFTDEFVIVYGVNHQATGKVTYSSFSIYADKDRWFGLINGTTLSPNFDQGGQPGDSARRFLCPSDPAKCPDAVKYLYAWKVARECGDEKYCMEVKVNDDPTKPFNGIDDQPYACSLWDVYSDPGHPINLGPFDLDKSEMFFLWRSYMEPGTLVSPDDNELVYDRAVYFGPDFAGQ